jgi:hypothetical protein
VSRAKEVHYGNRTEIEIGSTLSASKLAEGKWQSKFIFCFKISPYIRCHSIQLDVKRKEEEILMYQGSI